MQVRLLARSTLIGAGNRQYQPFQKSRHLTPRQSRGKSDRGRVSPRTQLLEPLLVCEGDDSVDFGQGDGENKPGQKNAGLAIAASRHSQPRLPGSVVGEASME